MPFPISLRGHLQLDLPSADENASTFPAVLAGLRAKRPLRLSSEGDTIRFKGGLGAGGIANWHLLIPISSGWVRIASTGNSVRLEYEIRFTQLVAIVSVMMLAVFAFGLIDHSLLVSGMVAALGWLWLFGANYALTAFRFPAFLRRAALRVHG